MHDDLLLPSDLDTDIQCDDMGDVVLGKYILPIGAGLSILCYTYLLWMYFVVKSPVLMRHPTALAIYKCIFELIFVQQYFWLPFLPTKKLYRDLTDSPPFYCNASTLAGVLAFITQFSLLASELCFLAISLDLRMAYTNPFSSFQQNRVYYAVYIFLSSLLGALVLILCGPQVYGLASEGVVWIQTKRIPYGAEYYAEPNYPKFFLFYFPLILIYVYCMWANFQYYRSHTKGFSQTLSNRIKIMQRSKRFTLSFLAYDTLTLTSEFASFVNYYDSRALNSLPSYCYCIRGIFSLAIILYCNHEDLSWRDLDPFSTFINEEENDLVALEGLLMQPHLNAALRVELLYFTTKGIMHAARDYEATEGLDLPSSAMASASNALQLSTEQPSAVVNQLHAGALKPTVFHTPGAAAAPDVGDALEESRCYSFDEDPRLGVRPSLVAPDDSGGGGGLLRASFTTRGSLFAHRAHRAADDAEGGVAMRETTRGGDSGGALAAELNKVSAVQSKAVTQEVEDAFLEYRQSRVSFAVATGGDRDLLRPLTAAPSAAEAQRLLRDEGDDDDRATRPPPPAAPSASRRPHAGSVSPPSGSPPATGGSAKHAAAPRASLWSRFSLRWPGAEEARPRSSSQGGARDTAADVEFSIRQPNAAGGSVSSSSASTAQRRMLSDWQQQQQQPAPRDRQSTLHGRGQLSSGSEEDEEPAWQRVVPGGAAQPAAQPARSVSGSRADAPPGRLLSLFAAPRASDGDHPIRGAAADDRRQSSDDAPRSVSSARDKIVRVVQSALANASLAARSVLNPAYREFRFKDFAPRLFAQIRQMHGISADEYARSFESTCRERFTEGRSGAFMFYAADQRCIVKSTTQEDIFALRSLLPAYVRYLQREPHTLLVRFVGAHCITMYGVDIYFTVMLNMFPPDQRAMSERYDLKGSWVNRHGNVRSKGGDSGRNAPKNRLVKEDRVHGAPLLQDNDFLQRISLRPETARALAEQIRHDVLFLRENGRMDYSLLIGVRRERFRVSAAGEAAGGEASQPVVNSSLVASQHRSHHHHFLSHRDGHGDGTGHGDGNGDRAAAADPFMREADGSFRAYMVEGPGLYYIGMIDLLQGWTVKKRLERLAKVFLQRKDGDGLSAMPPDDYAVRFYRRCVIDVFEHLDDAQMSELSWAKPRRGSTASTFSSTARPSGKSTSTQLDEEDEELLAHLQQEQLRAAAHPRGDDAGGPSEADSALVARLMAVHRQRSGGGDGAGGGGGGGGGSDASQGGSSGRSGDAEADGLTNSMRITAVVSPLAPHVQKQLQSDYV